MSTKISSERFIPQEAKVRYNGATPNITCFFSGFSDAETAKGLYCQNVCGAVEDGGGELLNDDSPPP